MVGSDTSPVNVIYDIITNLEFDGPALVLVSEVNGQGYLLGA